MKIKIDRTYTADYQIMRQYNFTFYHVDPVTDEVLDYTEKTVWANSRESAWKTAREWAYNNGYNDFEEEDN